MAGGDGRKPLVGISCCRRQMEGPIHRVGEKYIVAVATLAGAIPVLIPALGGDTDAALLERLDGLLLTGSVSNVEPRWYGGPASEPGTLHDPDRDATTLSLVKLAVARGLPVLGICRGLQELNVALGGTLHQNLHLLPGRLDHRADQSLSSDEQYGKRQTVSVAKDGWFEAWAGTSTLEVNSLHAQGIDVLAPSLVVEATAADGQIEAVRLASAAFCIGVQWHPEFQAARDEFSTVLFQAFGNAMRLHLRGLSAVA